MKQWASRQHNHNLLAAQNVNNKLESKLNAADYRVTLVLINMLTIIASIISASCLLVPIPQIYRQTLPAVAFYSSKHTDAPDSNTPAIYFDTST